MKGDSSSMLMRTTRPSTTFAAMRQLLLVSRQTKGSTSR